MWGRGRKRERVYWGWMGGWGAEWGVGGGEGFGEEPAAQDGKPSGGEGRCCVPTYSQGAPHLLTLDVPPI